MTRWWNPWATIALLRSELADTRRRAERWKGRALSAERANETLYDHLAGARRASAALRIERDEARAELAVRIGRISAAIARGNRTRALRRRGGLLPAPINEPAHPGDQRNTSTG